MWGIEDADEEQKEDDDKDEFDPPSNFMEFFKEDGIRSEDQERISEEDQERMSEEADRPRHKRVEPRPSKKEMEEHMITRIPLRAWCPHCIRGKARAT